MTDLALVFGSDLTVDASGDLATVDGTEEGVERILRRLLTNPAEYIWNPSYGAGLPQFLGEPVNTTRIQAVIRRQMLLEAIVARDPPPVITVTGRADNSVFVDIKYVDSTTSRTVALSASVAQDGTVAPVSFAIGVGRIGIDFLG
jgi:phage baseplate assembly protein W